MAFSRKPPPIQALKQHPLLRKATKEDLEDILSILYNRKAARDIVEDSETLRQRRAVLVGKRRDAVFESAWRALLRPLSQRLHGYRNTINKRPPHEHEFYATAIRVMEKTKMFIQKQRLLSLDSSKWPVRPSPGAVARSLGLPNSGAYWVDWVPDAIKQQVVQMEQQVGALRSKHAAAPNLFQVTPHARHLAQLESHRVSLQTQLQAAKEKLKLLDKNTQARQYMHVRAEVTVCHNALEALDEWPRTRVLPVNPIQVLGTTMKSVSEELDTLLPDAMSGLDPDDYKEHVSEALERAQERVARGKAQVAISRVDRGKAPLRPAQKKAKDTVDEAFRDAIKPTDTRLPPSSSALDDIY